MEPVKPVKSSQRLVLIKECVSKSFVMIDKVSVKMELAKIVLIIQGLKLETTIVDLISVILGKNCY